MRCFTIRICSNSIELEKMQSFFRIISKGDAEKFAQVGATVIENLAGKMISLLGPRIKNMLDLGVKVFSSRPIKI